MRNVWGQASRWRNRGNVRPAGGTPRRGRIRTQIPRRVESDLGLVVSIWQGSERFRRRRTVLWQVDECPDGRDQRPSPAL
jgi:hypothetical protein